MRVRVRFRVRKLMELERQIHFFDWTNHHRSSLSLVHRLQFLFFNPLISIFSRGDDGDADDDDDDADDGDVGKR